MCGLVAIAGANIADENPQISEMLQTLRFRGPDDHGLTRFKNCLLGHSRLSIIDIDRGIQPMSAKGITVVFNGEIYNYLELKQDLMSRGYSFENNSDTEVLLNAYLEWGTGVCARLDGMFAFVIWDERSQELLLVRDRLGKKPLFYFLDGNRIYIASELKALFAAGVIEPVIDYDSIDHYLKRMYIAPDRSVYSNVFQIPPGSSAIYANHKLRVSEYWTVPKKPKLSVSYEDAKHEVWRLLKNAIEKRVVTSDVKIGALLSGGVDSSLTTIMAHEILKGELETFSIDYHGEDSELKYAHQITSMLNCKNYNVSIGHWDFMNLSGALTYFDEPHADTSNYSQSLLSKHASERVKVVISGDGADELFCGYKWHVGDGFGSKRNHNLFERRVYDVSAFSRNERFRLWRGCVWPNDNLDRIMVDNTTDDFLHEVNRFDLSSHLPGQILSKIDRMGMMHGLEVRSPFLDSELLEFALRLPDEYKIGENSERKYILRDILSEYTSIEFAFRKKQGFGAPVAKWMLNKVIQEQIKQLLNENAFIRCILDGDEIDGHINNFYSRSETNPRFAQKLWVLISLEKWLITFNSHV